MAGSTRASRPAILAIVALVACATNDPTETSTVNSTPSDSPITIAYGNAPQQFGDLHLPNTGEDASPVVVLVHGGFWRNPYDLTLMEPLAADLVHRGFAVWNIEYRRLGDDGGGWPGTLTDVAAAVDRLAAIADDHPIDPERVAIVGHSAGGHLTLWAAGRAGLPTGVPGANPVVVPWLAVGQGAVVDLVGAAAKPLGNGAVMELLGGTPEAVPERYEVARPRLDAGPAMVSVVGTADDVVPPPYSVDPTRPGSIEVIEVAGAEHMDLIEPGHAAWAAVLGVLER